MKTLITGGTGSIGSAFVERYADRHEFAVLARSEARHTAFSERFPEATQFFGSVERISDVLHALDRFRPEAVVHAAAMKHVDLCESDPLAACAVNIGGTLNVVEACRQFAVKTLVGVSTDKANDSNVYGTTKRMMESILVSADSPSLRCSAVRLGNVAGSHGSVIQRWKEAERSGATINITDPEMRRFWMTPAQAANLIQLVIASDGAYGGTVVAKRMKQASVGKIAEAFACNKKIVGGRPGEKRNESLIGISELARTHSLEDYFVIGKEQIPEMLRPHDFITTADAEELTDAEIRELVA